MGGASLGAPAPRRRRPAARPQTASLIGRFSAWVLGAVVLAVALGAAGCLAVPSLDDSGRYACELDTDCPTGWACWERTDGSRRCLDRVECASLGDVACDDGEVCTVDVCDMDLATCTHRIDVGAACAPGGCDASAVYTPPSVCDAGGACVATAGEPCDDDDACTRDVCDADRGGCLHLPDLGLGCGVAGTWRGIFTRIRNDGGRDFRTLPLELELAVDAPAVWRFESSAGAYWGPNAIDATVLSSGEMSILDLDTALWLNVAPSREVIAGRDFGSVGPIFFVRVPDVAPPPDGLAGRWRALLVERRDDPDGARSRIFDTHAGPLELVDSGATACIAAGGASLRAAGAPADPASWEIREGACARLDADGGFTFQHDVGDGDGGGGERRERWRGWLTPARDVAVAVREVDDGAGGFAKPTGFVFLVRASVDMPRDAVEGAYAFARAGHNVVGGETLYCAGQARFSDGEAVGGVEVCNSTGAACEWRDTEEIGAGGVTTAPDGAVTGRIFAGAAVTDLDGQAAPVLDAIGASPLVIAQRVHQGADGQPRAVAGTFEIYVWQPPGIAPREAPLGTRGDEEPWCPPR